MFFICTTHYLPHSYSLILTSSFLLPHSYSLILTSSFLLPLLFLSPLFFPLHFSILCLILIPFLLPLSLSLWTFFWQIIYNFFNSSYWRNSNNIFPSTSSILIFYLWPYHLSFFLIFYGIFPDSEDHFYFNMLLPSHVVPP